MTQNAVQARVSAPAPAARPPTGRLAGVDLARGLAVFGMYAAHVGPDPSEPVTMGFLMELTHGSITAWNDRRGTVGLPRPSFPQNRPHHSFPGAARPGSASRSSSADRLEVVVDVGRGAVASRRCHR